MRENLVGASLRFSAYAVACAVMLVLLFAVFGQLRFFQQTTTYSAEFAKVSGLESGNLVTVAGVEVGKVQNIAINDDGTVRVEFSADASVVLTEGSRAVIRYQDLIGGRYLALEEGAGGVDRFDPGDTIPLTHTEPALDLNALIGGFRPLFRALHPDQVNKLTGQLIAAFQGQGPTIGSFLSQAAALTNTLADRDQLIGEVIANLNTLLGSLGDQSDQFAEAVDSLSELVDGLENRKQDIANGLAYTDAAAKSIADLLAQSRPPLQKVVPELDRTAGIIVADHEYVDNLLDTLPDAYQILGRQGLYGDFFSFYLCDVVLKMNGKGGQPVYVKLVGQTSGRCTPR
ncbi:MULTISPECIES: virulence factor Mce family protein [unclassified Mycobacterium]|uniref:virulence factor Mce family protein n=1 Tax=unclassified Mycobacterium TaxID=2642494 RepID=UPI00073FD867|nr:MULTISPECIES: virulence factor Mce family protein [unclassified Mycobacterium]KUH83136.1 mammalian cell entry protein [Mycobacterium sp. GA-0227b]KUH84454.1 mammalian cell entry protein [Mycobacterium sp. GA-1999]KUH89410.1 mammalian cell entry protein [Mycobacterium sp. IS-1556]